MLTSADNKTDIVLAALQNQQFLVNYCHRNGIKLKYHKAKGTTFLLYALLLSCTPSGLAVGTTLTCTDSFFYVSFVYRTLKSKGGGHRSTNKKDNVKPDEAQTELELKVEVNKGILR